MIEYAIPDAALDGRIAAVGLSGSGKTTAVKGAVERLLSLQRRTCVVDLLDGWWGLRLERDGKSPAFPVAIFGGRHGDLPLTESAGALIGEAVAKSSESTIVSLSELDGDAARRRFALAFFDALHKSNRLPLHLVIDEADFYAPQQPVKDGPGPLLLNRVKEIAARGRMRGFRCWTITQRSAKLHKDVLSQADTLIAMQLTSSQDRDALDNWIGDQSDKKTGAAILASLPKLERGQGVLWSPRLGILETKRFPLPATYDSSRTPDHGESIDDVSLSSLDVPGLRSRLASVEADTKANDPKALNARIAELEREAKKPPENITPNITAGVLADAEHRGYGNGYRAGHDVGIGTARAALKFAYDAINERFGEAQGLIDAQAFAQEQVNQLRGSTREEHRNPNLAPEAHRKSVTEPITQAARAVGTDGTEKVVGSIPAGRTNLKPAILKALDAIAWWRVIGFDPIDRSRACVLAGLSPRSSTFGVYLAELLRMGLIWGGDGKVGLTDAGKKCAKFPNKADLTNEHVHAKICSLLSGKEIEVFDAVYRRHPKEIARDDVARAVGLSPTASTCGVYLASVSATGAIESGSRGHVIAADWLFVQ